jgi:ComF family protein
MTNGIRPGATELSELNSGEGDEGVSGIQSLSKCAINFMTLATVTRWEYNRQVMTIVRTPALRRAGAWLVQLLDELIPPGLEPEGAADWQPDAVDVYCPRCGASAGQGSVTPRGCAFCVNKQVPWQRMTRLGYYGQPLDDWVKQLKFHRRWRYGQWLGHQLAQTINQPRDPEKLIVCPVPMHRFRRWRRGYNQADLIARAVAKSQHWQFAPILKRIQHTPPQTAIVPSRRHDNVKHSFDIEPVDLTGFDVILIDDVKTSGATLSACTRLLTQAGAQSVHAAVVAVADPKGQAFATI